MKYSVVLTTINKPELLIDYAENFLKFDHKSEVEILVIGDCKTTEENEQLMLQISKMGILAEYFNIAKGRVKLITGQSSKQKVFEIK